jgi:hypothetical protein
MARETGTTHSAAIVLAEIQGGGTRAVVTLGGVAGAEEKTRSVRNE